MLGAVAQAYLKDSVAAYLPTDEDTDYPNRLIAAAKSKSEAPEAGAEPANQIPEVAEVAAEAAGGSPSRDSSLASLDPYSLWYPPLQVGAPHPHLRKGCCGAAAEHAWSSSAG